MVEPLIYRLADLEGAVGLSKTTIYELIRNGQFPQPIMLAQKNVGWRADEVREWVTSRPRRRAVADDVSG